MLKNVCGKSSDSGLCGRNIFLKSMSQNRVSVKCFPFLPVLRRCSSVLKSISFFGHSCAYLAHSCAYLAWIEPPPKDWSRVYSAISKMWESWFGLANLTMFGSDTQAKYDHVRAYPQQLNPRSVGTRI